MNSFLAYVDKSSYYPGDNITVYTHVPTNYNMTTLLPSWCNNQNVKYVKTSVNNVKKIHVILKQNTSTPGIVLNNVSVINTYVKINHNITTMGDFKCKLLVRDLSMNVFLSPIVNTYTVYTDNNCTIIKIPKSIIVNIYIVASGNIKIDDIFTVHNFSLEFFSSKPKPMIISLYSDDKDLVNTVETYNTSNQQYKSYSFATGCDWLLTNIINVPSTCISGYYFIVLEYNNLQFNVCVIIKSLNINPNNILVLANTNTWNAYNTWGGLDGKFSCYTYIPSQTYIENSEFIGYNANGISKVSRFTHYERPNTVISNYVNLFLKNELSNKTLYAHVQYPELYLIAFLKSLNYSFDVITDRDLAEYNNRRFLKYKILFLHVHPEYWTFDALKNLNFMHKHNTNIIYLGGNSIYWMSSFNGNQMEVRKNGDYHLNGFKGGLMNSLNFGDEILVGRKLLKVNYKNNYTDISTTIINNSFYPINIDHKLFNQPNKIILHNGSFGHKNLNSNNINSGVARWEVDFPDNKLWEKYIIATTKDKLCAMMFKDKENDGYGKVFCACSITFTGSLLVDENIKMLLVNVIIEMLK